MYVFYSLRHVYQRLCCKVMSADRMKMSLRKGKKKIYRYHVVTDAGDFGAAVGDGGSGCASCGLTEATVHQRLPPRVP